MFFCEWAFNNVTFDIINTQLQIKVWISFVVGKDAIVIIIGKIWGVQGGGVCQVGEI